MAGGLKRELVQSTFRWAPLLSAAAAAAVHAQDVSADTITWAETTTRVEQVGLILFPIFFFVATWESLRNRRFGLANAERLAVRSRVSIRAGQYCAVLLWTLGAAIAAVLIGLMVSAGAHGIHGELVLPMRLVPALVLASTLGFAVGSVIRHGLALLASLLILAGLFAWELWAPSTPWLLLNPLHAAFGEEPRAGIAALETITAGSGMLVNVLITLFVIGMSLAVLALTVLVLRPAPFEVLVALVLLMLGAAALAVSTGWFLELLQHGGLWYD